ncbi:flagellar basal body-associated protein FliL [Maioricimonas rarisocia]|uniref:Flagellar protein FliL n=1 Tax=Maioricimonas rarisocia TaxID=2528026 RepID=A0A517ZCQ8_9PLAN|nr:flagellar basal body-associated FliL family protein [Maioricimonas rarisocia]QDU40231.1 flagellar basal body-associated protein FliL [Maioricimonas rarisocia]
MADEPQQTQDDAVARPSGPGLIGWIAVGLVAAAAGFAVPFFLPTAEATKSDETEPKADYYELLPPEKAMFLEFGEVTVNLDEGRMNRYLRLKISLQINKDEEEAIKKALEKRQLILRNWLLSHLSDKDLDSIRGAAGQNMLRREIRDQFNTVMFPDGFDRIHDVLFEEFNVQ